MPVRRPLRRPHPRASGPESLVHERRRLRHPKRLRSLRADEQGSRRPRRAGLRLLRPPQAEGLLPEGLAGRQLHADGLPLPVRGHGEPRPRADHTGLGLSGPGRQPLDPVERKNAGRPREQHVDVDAVRGITAPALSQAAVDV